MTKISIPWWLSLIVILETLPMFIGPIVALTNPAFMGGPDAEVINHAAYIYTARNVAVGIAFILAYLLKSGPMLFILILVRLLTDLVDMPTFLAFDLATNTPRLISIFVVLYYIPAVLALRYLWKKMKSQEGVAQG